MYGVTCFSPNFLVLFPGGSPFLMVAHDAGVVKLTALVSWRQLLVPQEFYSSIDGRPLDHAYGRACMRRETYVHAYSA